MTDPQRDMPTDPQSEPFEAVSGPGFREIALPFWTGPARRIAWMLTCGVVVVVIANVGILFSINRWSKGFFDTLENRAIEAIARTPQRRP